VLVKPNLLVVGGLVWNWPPRSSFVNNFFIRNVQTKIQNVHTCANDEQSFDALDEQTRMSYRKLFFSNVGGLTSHGLCRLIS